MSNMNRMQKKISRMREAIDGIKLDIKSMRSQREHYSNKNNSTISSKPINKKYNNHTIASYEKPFERQPKSNFNQFKTNCPIKKDCIISYSSNKTNKPCLVNHNGRKYNFNYPLDSISHINQEIKNNVDSDRDKHKDKKSIEEELNESKQKVRKQRNIAQNLSDNLKRASTDYQINLARLPLANGLNEINQYIEKDKDNHKSLMITTKRNHHHSNSNIKIQGREYEDMVNEIIAISNKYSAKQMKISPDNLIENYRREMREMKLKNELINKMCRLYNAKTGVDISNEKDSILRLWRWIKALSYTNHSIDRNNEDCNDSNSDGDKSSDEINKDNQSEYKSLCERIMKEYKMKNINELTLFIDVLLKRVTNNDCFVEGIKNILLHKYKLDER